MNDPQTLYETDFNEVDTTAPQPEQHIDSVAIGYTIAVWRRGMQSQHNVRWLKRSEATGSLTVPHHRANDRHQFSDRIGTVRYEQ